MYQFLRLGKKGLIFLLSFTCNYVVSVRRGFLFLLVLGVGGVILLWHSLGLPYGYLSIRQIRQLCIKRFDIHVLTYAAPSVGGTTA